MSIVPRARSVQNASASAPPNACGISAFANATCNRPIFFSSAITTDPPRALEPRELQRRRVPGREQRREPQHLHELPPPSLRVHSPDTRRQLARSSNPAARNNRSNVSTVGTFRPASYAATVECEVPARPASSRNDKPDR